jgi:hypothetical protein
VTGQGAKLGAMIPPRDATDQYLASTGRVLDVTFDVDLGQLVRGHHVIARGIELGRTVRMPRQLQQLLADRAQRTAELAQKIARSRLLSQPPASALSVSYQVVPATDTEMVEVAQTEPELHYEFVPGISRDEEAAHPFFWYWMLSVSDDVGTTYSDANGGARGPAAGGDATHATRDLGGRIPDQATWLALGFEPPSTWLPPEPWRRQLVIDLSARTVQG